MSQPTQAALQYGGATILYELVFSQRATLAIHVHPDLRVIVEAPAGSDLSEIEKHLHKRAAWILRQQRNFRRYSVNFPPRLYLSGETYRYLGQQYRLKVLQLEGAPSTGGKEAVALDREYLNVTTRRKADPTHTRDLLNAWYHRQALALFAERVAAWYPHFERLGAPLPEVTARQMISRWGSCTAGGKVTLNTKLVMVHRHLIDYVVVHELCHLQEHNHGLAFQRLLTRILPDWKERKQKLDSFDFG